MRELTGDPFYEAIRGCGRCVIDYCLIGDDVPHQGYRSHKAAVLFAMLRIIERDIADELTAGAPYAPGAGDEPFPWSLDAGRAKARPIDPSALLHIPGIVRTDSTGQRHYDCPLPDPLKGDRIPYWYAFWETPHPSGYGPDDFRRINSVLFPKGAEALEAYEWTTDWSNYFDDGREWWGSACWSVYDRDMDRYAVIMASATD